jgi:glycosyltransferase involved in cell wall biosynthesis
MTSIASPVVEWRPARLDITCVLGTADPHADGHNGQHIVALIPAYNEERFIASVVLKARRYADTVLVVDDGSSDETAALAEAAGAVVERHEHNRGKGAALNTGFRVARGLGPDAVVILDGDAQHPPEEMGMVLGPILRGEADIVVGSRYLQANRTPAHRILGQWAVTWLTNLTSGIRLTDSQSGYRAFSPRALQALSLSSRGFSVESEMQFLARDCGLTMVEVPVTIHYTDKPKRNVMLHGMVVLNGILKIIGQHRPLLYFGLPGLIVFVVGLLWGGWVVQIYQKPRLLAAGYAMVSVLLSMLGSLSLFVGIILHSMRGLLLELLRSNGEPRPDTKAW